MDGNKTYGPTPLKLEAFDSIESITGIITDIVEKRFDNGPRWEITVDDWTLVVNDTNYRAVKKTYGADSKGWLHKPITAFKGKLRRRNGEEMDGICLRVPEKPDAEDAEDLAPAPLPPDKLDAANAELRAANADKFDDDIPF